MLVLRININDNNKYEYISYFGDFNINKDIRSLYIYQNSTKLEIIFNAYFIIQMKIYIQIIIQIQM